MATFSAGVTDTGGKFATAGVVGTGGKLANISANFRKNLK
jgi:hypothetical protein